jgi:serine/threonine protein kinase
VDVGNGLHALHASGIVHGDLESKNVLICNSDSGAGVVAKLADFGCAIADLDPSDNIKLAAFTPLWEAPESHRPLPRNSLKHTDIYSYGLLVWRVTLNGTNPFKYIEGLSMLGDEDLRQQVKILKLEDCLLPLSKATLHHPVCNIDVDTGMISCVLDLTLLLDSPSRDVLGLVKLLSNGSPVIDFHAEPLKHFSYQNV